MPRPFARKTTVSFMIFLCVSLPAIAHAGDDVTGLSGDEAPAHSGPNPLIEEMRVLDSSFRNVVSAVALGDGQKVSRALDAMHGTMEKTHEGLRTGAVKVPRNAGRTREFMRRDRTFHGDIERLEAAARIGDRRGMLSLTKRLLDQCVSCHRMFRE